MSLLEFVKFKGLMEKNDNKEEANRVRGLRKKNGMSDYCFSFYPN